MLPHNLMELKPMSTRSNIIVRLRNGQWHNVYCHSDGYPSHNGRILLESYNSQSKAERLVKHGDLSSLGPHCDKPKGHSFDNKIPGYCVYYGRDRGEPDTGGTFGDSLESVWPTPETWAEFVYVWDGDAWKVAELSGPRDKPADLVTVAHALEAWAE